MPAKKAIPPKATRSARQTRAKATVEAIFEATAQIIEQRGLAKLTTNHVAALAGVSIGSFYEYFANKDALLHAWCERYVASVKQAADALFSTFAAVPLSQAIEPAVDAMFAINQVRPVLYTVLLEEIPKRLGVHPVFALDQHFEDRLVEYLEGQPEPLRAIDLRAASYVINRAGKAVTMSFFLEGQPAARLPAVRAALIDLFTRALLP